MSEDTSTLDEKRRRRTVYVVYGQNKNEKEKIDATLKTLGLTAITKKDVVGLTGGSSFIGRILDVAFEQAQAVIVLLTGDEEAQLRKQFQRPEDERCEKIFCLQPTQDQIFEAGYAFGKLPERTILLRRGDIRLFSDISGRYILNYAETVENPDLLRDCLQHAGCILNDTEPSSSSQDNTAAISIVDPKSVFVVYGRNITVMKEMFAFLRSLDLSPMRWYESIRRTKLGAPYTGTVVAAGMKDAQAVLVLLTGDDEVRSKKTGSEVERIVYPQARPNVLFEAGMAFSKYKKRIILVQVGKVRPCPALHGRNMVNLNNRPGPRWDLMQRLDIVGCPVNFHGKWNTTGNFSVSED